MSPAIAATNSYASISLFAFLVASPFERSQCNINTEIACSLPSRCPSFRISLPILANDPPQLVQPVTLVKKPVHAHSRHRSCLQLNQEDGYTYNLNATGGDQKTKRKQIPNDVLVRRVVISRWPTCETLLPGTRTNKPKRDKTPSKQQHAKEISATPPHTQTRAHTHTKTESAATAPLPLPPRLVKIARTPKSFFHREGRCKMIVSVETNNLYRGNFLSRRFFFSAVVVFSLFECAYNLVVP